MEIQEFNPAERGPPSGSSPAPTLSFTDICPEAAEINKSFCVQGGITELRSLGHFLGRTPKGGGGHMNAALGKERDEN